MTITLRHALEVSDGSATLYLSGTLSGDDSRTLERVCRGIPARVRTLRLDLRGVTRLEADAMDGVRCVLRYWRESRDGSCRLSFATQHLLATYHTNDAPTPAWRPSAPLHGAAEPHAALTAMYL